MVMNMEKRWVRRALKTFASLCLFLLSSQAFAQWNPESPTFVLPHDPIPNPFTGTLTTLRSVRSGAYTDPTTWDLGRVPNQGDTVRIQHAVRLCDGSSRSAKTFGILANGTLEICGSSTLLFQHLVVLDGSLRADDRASLVVRNLPFESYDPLQYLNGIVVLGGEFVTRGAAKTPFEQLKYEVLASQTQLTLRGTPHGWSVGDTLFLPDTRQLKYTERGTAFASQAERVTITAINGNQVSFTPATAFSHYGPRNAAGLVTSTELEMFPHVANLTRSIKIRSENKSGNRGHILITARASLALKGAEIYDMGRTTFHPISATNIKGRYALHLHHLLGPVNPERDMSRLQYTVSNNSVHDGMKGGIVFHGTHYGAVEENVVVDVQGGGLVSEVGEIGNRVVGNFVARIRGFKGKKLDGHRVTIVKAPTFPLDQDNGIWHAAGDARNYDENWHMGTGLWMPLMTNHVVGNVFNDCDYAGMTSQGDIGAAFTNAVAKLPLFPGADLQNGPVLGYNASTNRTNFATEVMEYGASNGPQLRISDNTVYGGTERGFSYIGRFTGIGAMGHLQYGPPLPYAPPEGIERLKVWHTHGQGITQQQTVARNLLFTDYVFRGDPSKVRRDRTMVQIIEEGSRLGDNNERVFGVLDFYASLRRADIQGADIGIFTRSNRGDYEIGEPEWTPRFIDTFIDARVPFLVNNEVHYREGGSDFVIETPTFGSTLTSQPLFYFRDRDDAGPGKQFEQSRVWIKNYLGKTYQVFWPDQHPDYLIPQLARGTPCDTFGTAPVNAASTDPQTCWHPGLTNAEAWSLYGRARAGAIRPGDAITLAAIGGKSEPGAGYLTPTLRNGTYAVTTVKEVAALPLYTTQTKTYPASPVRVYDLKTEVSGLQVRLSGNVKNQHATDTLQFGTNFFQGHPNSLTNDNYLLRPQTGVPWVAPSSLPLGFSAPFLIAAQLNTANHWGIKNGCFFGGYEVFNINTSGQHLGVTKLPPFYLCDSLRPYQRARLTRLLIQGSLPRTLPTTFGSVLVANLGEAPLLPGTIALRLRLVETNSVSLVDLPGSVAPGAATLVPLETLFPSIPPQVSSGTLEIGVYDILSDRITSELAVLPVTIEAIPTPTATPTLVVTPIPTAIPTAIPTSTPTRTPSVSPTRTPSRTPTRTPTSTSTHTQTPTSSPTVLARLSATPTALPSPSMTPTNPIPPQSTLTPSPTPADTLEPPSPSRTPTVTPSVSPTKIPPKKEKKVTGNVRLIEQRTRQTVVASVTLGPEIPVASTLTGTIRVRLNEGRVRTLTFALKPLKSNTRYQKKWNVLKSPGNAVASLLSFEARLSSRDRTGRLVHQRFRLENLGVRRR